MSIIQAAGRKGGVGKSTLACAIAAQLALDGDTVLLADVDAEQGTAYEWTGDRIENKITPNLAGCMRFTSLNEMTKLFDLDKWKRDRGEREDIKKGVIVCCRIHGEQQLAKAFGHYSFDHIVVDSKPQANHLTSAIALLCDLTVISSNASLSDIRPTGLLADRLDKEGSAYRICFNRVYRIGLQESRELAMSKAFLHHNALNLLDGFLPERAAYRRAMERGRAVTECNYGKLANQAGDLIDEILATVEELKKHDEVDKIAASLDRKARKVAT